MKSVQIDQFPPAETPAAAGLSLEDILLKSAATAWPLTPGPCLLEQKPAAH